MLYVSFLSFKRYQTGVDENYLSLSLCTMHVLHVRVVRTASRPSKWHNVGR